MKIVLAVGLLALCTFAPALYADPAADSAAISARGQEFVAAWNRDDAAGIAALWTPRGDLINPFGRVARGREEVQKLFADEHSTFMKGTTFKVDEESVRVLGPAVGILDWDVEILGMKGPDGAAAPPFKNHVTIVLVKRDGKWWVEAARPVIYPPAGGAPK